jgi:DNA replication protein DnaC
VKHLADVIQLAQRAQQSAMTPEQIAEEQRRDEQRGRAVTLSLSAPPIRPEDKHAIVFDTLAETPWLEAVREWHAGSKSVLVLSGSVGSGKTVAACWAMAGDNGLFVSAANLARIVGDFDRTEWRRFASCRLLVVDDLGVSFVVSTVLHGWSSPATWSGSGLCPSAGPRLASSAAATGGG